MPRCNTRGNRQIARRRDRRGVVLEPREPPRAVHPESAQESDLADGGADVGRQPRARGEHQQHVAGGRAEAGRDEHDRADIRRRRRSPTPARATAPSPSARPRPARTSAPTPRGAPSTRRSPMPVTRTSLPGRRGRRDGEQVTRQPIGLRATLLRGSLDRRPPRRGHTRSESRTPRAGSAPGESTPAAPSSRPAAESTRAWKTATCTCGRARTPDCGASRADRDTPGRS